MSVRAVHHDGIAGQACRFARERANTVGHVPFNRDKVAADDDNGLAPLLHRDGPGEKTIAHRQAPTMNIGSKALHLHADARCDIHFPKSDFEPVQYHATLHHPLQWVEFQSHVLFNAPAAIARSKRILVIPDPTDIPAHPGEDRKMNHQRTTTRTRRTFIKETGAIAASVAMAGNATADDEEQGLRFSGMVTVGDWAVSDHSAHRFKKDPESAIKYIIDRMAESGFSRVYWRTTDGCGQTLYPSQVTNAAQQFVVDAERFPEQFQILKGYIQSGRAFDFSKFNSVTLARDLAHQAGMEFWAWHEHAEDHGAVGQISDKALEHPEWLSLNRDGKHSACRFSWAIPEAVQHRVDLAAEVLSLGVDGLMFDFIKSMPSTVGVGMAAHFDDKGVWYCTYDEPAVEAFKSQTGRDPFQIPNDDLEWVQFRANYMTDFVREVRQIQQAEYPDTRIGLFGCPPGRPGLCTTDKMIPLADPLQAYLEDHDTWTREGLMDDVVTAYNINCPNAQQLRELVNDSRSRVHSPARFNGIQLQVYNGEKACSLPERARVAKEAGCRELVLFETTPIEAQGKWDVVRKTVDQLG